MGMDMGTLFFVMAMGGDDSDDTDDRDDTRSEERSVCT